ncbi:MAG: hypothetical protein IMZ40_01790, partial [Bacilli bacterium]|nr:hypothetical protein [Bacilli bacterium]
MNSPVRHILRDMPDPKELENLLKLSVQFADYHEEIEGKDDPNRAIPLSPSQPRNVGHIIETAVKLTNSAEFLASVSPHFFNIAKEFCRMGPELLKSALAFQNLTKTFIPLFEGRDAMIARFDEYEREIARLKEVEATCKGLEQNLRTSKDDVERLTEQSARQTEERKRMQDVLVELKTALKNPSDTAMTEVFVLGDSEDTQESEDKLSLPLDEGTEAKCKVLEQKLKISEGDVEHLNQQLLRLTEEVTKMRKVNAELKAISKIPSDVAISPMIILEDNEKTQEPKDRLSLSFEKAEAADNPDITNVKEGHVMSRFEATPQPSIEKLSAVCVNAETQTEDHELEELKHQLEEAIQAKVSVESDLN